MSGDHRRKNAIRDVLERLAEVAASAGMPSTASDIRQVRIPKLDEGRFSLVVLGEFNHGKSTFINALLALPDPWTDNAGGATPSAQAILPTGITPTTAVLTLSVTVTRHRPRRFSKTAGAKPCHPTGSRTG